MKLGKKIFALAVFVTVITVSAFAQNAPKIIAVVNSASWCSVCKANGERAMGAFMENNKAGMFQFVMNDVSSKETTSASAAGLAKAGVTKAMAPYKASGVVYFFDAKTKKPLTQITVANTNEEIAMVMNMLLKEK